MRACACRWEDFSTLIRQAVPEVQVRGQGACVGGGEGGEGAGGQQDGGVPALQIGVQFGGPHGSTAGAAHSQKKDTLRRGQEGAYGVAGRV